MFLNQYSLFPPCYIQSPVSSAVRRRQPAPFHTWRGRKWADRFRRNRCPSQLCGDRLSTAARVHHIESEPMSAQFQRHAIWQPSLCYAIGRRGGSRCARHRNPTKATAAAHQFRFGDGAQRRRRWTQNGAGCPGGGLDGNDSCRSRFTWPKGASDGRRLLWRRTG